MESIKANKLLTGLVLLLMVMNITLAVLLFRQLPGKGRGTFAPPADNMEFLQQELSLTRDQVEQIVGLRRAHFSALRPVLDSLRMVKDQLLQGIEDGSLSGSGADSLLAALTPLQASVEKQTFLHFAKMREVLTPGQQHKLKGLLRELLPPPGARPPGAGGPPPAPSADGQPPKPEGVN